MKDGGQAFAAGTQYTLHPGMSLRDYFAAAAISGILASEHAGDLLKNDTRGAYIAYAVADAMLAARETKEEKS